MSVVTAAERRALDPVPSSPQASQRRALRRGFVAALGAGAVFVLLQGLLAAYNLHVFRDAVAKRLDQASTPFCLGHCLGQVLPESIFAYAGFALAGLVVASAGHRLLFALPASLYVLYPVTQFSHAPQPIGQQWWVPCYQRCPAAWFGSPWFGSLIDLALVLAPAAVVAWSVRPERWPGTLDASAFAALGLAVGLILLTYRTATVIDRAPELSVVLVVGAFSVAAGARRPWWPWAHVIAATAASGYFVWAWSSIVAPDTQVTISLLRELSYDFAAVIPIVVMALVASSWSLFSVAFRKAMRSPLGLVAALNMLNLADALLTWFAVTSGGALELNPFVRTLGLPFKLVAVGALSLLLYKRRPAALVWPIAVLLWVLCYHISGLVVNG